MVSLELVKYSLIYKPYIRFIETQVCLIYFVAVKGFLIVEVGR